MAIQNEVTNSVLTELRKQLPEISPHSLSSYCPGKAYIAQYPKENKIPVGHKFTGNETLEVLQYKFVLREYRNAKTGDIFWRWDFVGDVINE